MLVFGDEGREGCVVVVNVFEEVEVRGWEEEVVLDEEDTMAGSELAVDGKECGRWDPPLPPPMGARLVIKGTSIVGTRGGRLLASTIRT